MLKLLIFVAFVTLAKSHDVIIGADEEGKKIFDEERQAGAAIVWRQIQNVTINASDDEIISKIVVTDLRPDKEGHASIVDGGKGQKYVTLELKSPSLLTGFHFHVEVYSVTKDKARITTSTTTQKTPNNEKDQANIYPPILSSSNPEETKFPRSISQDTNTNNEKKSVEANAEDVPRITIDLSGKTLETKATDTLNNNENKTPSRHIRDATQESDAKSNEPNVHNDKMYTGVPNFPEHTTNTAKSENSDQNSSMVPPAQTSGIITAPRDFNKQISFGEGNSKQASPKFNEDSVLPAVNDGKRDARDTDSKHNADYSKTIGKSDESGQNSSMVPPAQTSGIPTAPHDFNKHISLGEGNFKQASPKFNADSVLPVVNDGKLDARDTDSKHNAHYLKTTAKSDNSDQNSSMVPPAPTSGISTAPHDFNRQISLSEGNSKQASPKFNADSVLPAINDGKRDARDTDSKHNTDYSKTTAKSEKSSTTVPPAPTSGINTAPHDFNRQTSLGKGNNNSETYYRGALPVELAKDSSNKSNTSDKERMARDTQGKSKTAPPTIITNEGPKFTLPHVNIDDIEEEKVNVYPPMEETKRNDTANPANPRSFAPIPYADLTSTTTEKSEIKKDTDQKLAGKENKEAILKNTPQTFGQQKHTREQKPVISIQ